MTTMYAAAKFELHATPITQWKQLSDLTMVAVELVRLAWEIGRPLDAVIECFEEAISQAECKWDEYQRQADEDANDGS